MTKHCGENKILPIDYSDRPQPSGGLTVCFLETVEHIDCGFKSPHRAIRYSAFIRVKFSSCVCVCRDLTMGPSPLQSNIFKNVVVIIIIIAIFDR
jgi:hypothetical protein